MEAASSKSKWTRLPSVAQGAGAYLVALLLALLFRHVVFGKYSSITLSPWSP